MRPLKAWTVDDLENMRALRHQAMKIVGVKKFFREEGFTDDQTVTLFNLQLRWDGLQDIVDEANRIDACHSRGIAAYIYPIRGGDPVIRPDPWT